ncbi:mechanosensitive ion channel protein MscL [Serinicoccus sp. CNJ-927]|uniref:large conductance mechanosensitive channel protein MscL n=1 Tax=unclassified Serinicoccus TaxID=2643101 RepID=UPI00095A3208|nr:MULTISPECIES: large conductance mechanosensitive channel protein MscL [unclassified Serinicoccus]OLT18777.1 mechanosensitive ion channel protein MscL [Serinicoccus sp. CUA-874]OLT43358.1 mechanosensitive ion channel protein MscL [Serinicoccus sp. CNJ-927]
MLSGFKDFIMRGNVIELAVAVVIGSAFAAVVDTIVSSIITPLLNAAGGAEVGGLKFEIINGRADTAMDFAAIINALIVFLLTAAVVYFVLVAPMNKVSERMNRNKPVEEEIVTDEVATLREIRDLLAQRRADGSL